MNEDTLQEKDYMTSKDAGALLGYTHDYVSRLCRQGKMSGIQKGREWFVTQEEINAFKKRHKVELQEKKVELSKKFSQIRLAAEAQKRKDREFEVIAIETKWSADDVVTQSTQSATKKTISFSMPQQIVAVAVLAVLILAPNVFNVILNTPVAFKQPASVSQNVGSKLFIQSIEEGIQTTIETQSTIIEPTAAVFSFVPHVINGNWQFIKAISELPNQLYVTWTMIGNGYLSLYVKQGELVYESFQNLNTMGASVLWGYELLGQSFVVGSRDIFQSYIEIFNIKPNITFFSDKISQFSINVKEGSEYVVANTLFVLNSTNNQIHNIAQSFFENTGANMFAMYSTFTYVSNVMTANASTLIDFDLQLNKEFDIRVINVGE